jgi:hypothetical protein
VDTGLKTYKKGENVLLILYGLGMGDLNATVTASSATSNNKNCSLETASQEKKNCYTVHSLNIQKMKCRRN